ncbi:MAG: hypothetical protein H6726_10645 [Sandaracinaceae bacterium]|nr:hypothetical protein [Sandaracinaceae bacterium]
MLHGAAFIHEVELWSPLRGNLFRCVVASAAGQQEREASIEAGVTGAARVVRRVLATCRPELSPSGREDVLVGVPVYCGARLATVAVWRCHSPSGQGGGIEVWEPSRRGDLVHAEGFYGTLTEFELSSRLARFAQGIGLPGIAWDRCKPHIIDDVRASPLFLRAALAREHALAVGLGVPIVRGGAVEHVLVFLTAQRVPPASAIEIWVPDTQGRLWLEHGTYLPGLEALARASRTTCLMPGEGAAGRAASAKEPLVWTREDGGNDATDRDATHAGLTWGVALPILRDEVLTAVLLLRS